MKKIDELENNTAAALLSLINNEHYDLAANVILSTSRQEVKEFLAQIRTREKTSIKIEEIFSYIETGCFEEASVCVHQLPVGTFPSVLISFIYHLEEFIGYTTEIAKGNLSTKMPDKNNFLTMSIKNLHSKLNHLVWQLKQVAQGDYGQTVDYMGDLSTSFNSMIEQLKKWKMQVEYEKTHNVLTGLLNRTEFMRQVSEVIKARPDMCGILLYGGLDNLKSINETYGHKYGDDYLIAVAEAFRMFTNSGAIAGHVTGDEFAVYLYGYNEQPNILAIEKEFNEKLKQFFEFYDTTIKIRMSFGVSFYPQDTADADDLFKYASYTMFQVKNKNRGTFMRFSSELYRNKANTFERLEKLSRLLDEKLLRFAFQPVVKLADMSVIGYEALMRPIPTGFSGPLDLLSLAEEQSKLYQLEKITYEIIFDVIFRHLSRLEGKRIFFNTISTSFLEDQVLEKIHPRYTDICRHLTIEVLESTIDVEKHVCKIDSFRDRRGSLIALDDYGSGYSTDLRLLSMKPDIVKIDRLFINGIEDNIDKQHALFRIISYCNGKGICSLAEGIETESQLQMVNSMGFTYGQGYYLGRPDYIF